MIYANITFSIIEYQIIIFVKLELIPIFAQTGELIVNTLLS